MLFLWGWGIHSGWFSPAACLVHLGEEHWQPGEDSPRDERRTPLGCSCEQNERLLLLLMQNRESRIRSQSRFFFPSLNLVAPCSTHHSIHFKWSGIYLGTKSSSKYFFQFNCFEARYLFFISENLTGSKLKMTCSISFACDSCNLIKSTQFCCLLMGRSWSKADLLALSSGRKSGVLSVTFFC